MIVGLQGPQQTRPTGTQSIYPGAESAVRPREVAELVSHHRLEFFWRQRLHERKTQHQVVTRAAENAEARVLHDGGIEVAREEHAVHARRGPFGAQILDETEQVRTLRAREHASLWRLEAHPHCPKHDVDQDEECPANLTQQQRRVIDRGAHPHDESGSADKQNQARRNVAVTEEGQRPELSAIAGWVRRCFLLEPPNERLVVILSHAFQIRRTGKH